MKHDVNKTRLTFLGLLVLGLTMALSSSGNDTKDMNSHDASIWVLDSLYSYSGISHNVDRIIFEGRNLDSISFLPEKKTKCSYSKCDDIGLIGEYAFFTPLCMNDLRMQQLYFCLLKDSSIFVTDREHFDAYYSHSSGLIPVQLIDKKK